MAYRLRLTVNGKRTSYGFIPEATLPKQDVLLLELHHYRSRLSVSPLPFCQFLGFDIRTDKQLIRYGK